jgi:holo-[acyl-carrier protein] synthase
VSVRVGIDLVDVEDVRDALRLLPDSYLRRVYTDREVADCSGLAGVDARRLAARFAAKEAALKVLRPEDDAVAWPAIEVREHAGGAVLQLGEQARALADRRRVIRMTLSLGHTRETAFAIVVADLRS